MTMTEERLDRRGLHRVPAEPDAMTHEEWEQHQHDPVVEIVRYHHDDELHLAS